MKEMDFFSELSKSLSRNPEAIAFFQKGKKGEQRAGSKYYKRIPHPSGEGYLYFYTKEEYHTYQKTEKKKGLWSKVKNLFKTTEDGVKKKFKESYSEFTSQVKEKISQIQFEDYSLEYFARKEKIDQRIKESEKAQTTPKEKFTKEIETPVDISTESEPIKELTQEEIEKKAKKSVFNYWYNKLKKPKQEAPTEFTEPVEAPSPNAQAENSEKVEENNFDSMPKEEAEPVETPQLEKPKSYRTVNDQGKTELYFDKEEYDKLDSNTKYGIKRFFLWSPKRKAWVSKGKNLSFVARQILDKIGLPEQGINGGEGNENAKKDGVEEERPTVPETISDLVEENPTQLTTSKRENFTDLENLVMDKIVDQLNLPHNKRAIDEVKNNEFKLIANSSGLADIVSDVMLEEGTDKMELIEGFQEILEDNNRNSKFLQKVYYYIRNNDISKEDNFETMPETETENEQDNNITVDIEDEILNPTPPTTALEIQLANQPKTIAEKIDEKVQENIKEQKKEIAIEKIESLSMKKTHARNMKIKALLESKTDDEMTEEDKALLALYEGNGGQTQNKEAIAKGEIVSDKKLLYEFYTPQHMIDKTWQIIEGYFNPGDKILEPSGGTGRWIKDRPYTFDVSEIDPISARISKILYPDQTIRNESFHERFMTGPIKKANQKYKGEIFDGAVGNPPYGKMTGEVAGIDGKGWQRMETYFMKRSLDTVKEGGVIAMVVPSSFLEKGPNDPDKKKVMENCELVDAYRMPMGAFGNTQERTDLVILRKNTTSTQDNTDSFNGRFFEKNPNKIIGEQNIEKDRWGKETKVTRGNIDDFLNMPIEPPKEMSEAQKDAIAKGLIGNQNAKKNRTPIENENKKIVKRASTLKQIADPIAAAKTEPGQLFTQEEFNEKYQKNSDPIDKQLVERTNTLGYIDDISGIPKEKICYFDGQYTPHYLYATGDLNEKLERLEIDKDEMAPEDYQRQKEMLEKAIPSKVSIDNITISPLDPFFRSFSFADSPATEYINKLLGNPTDSMRVSTQVEGSRGTKKGTAQLTVYGDYAIGNAVDKGKVDNTEYSLYYKGPNGDWRIIAPSYGSNYLDNENDARRAIAILKQKQPKEWDLRQGNLWDAIRWGGDHFDKVNPKDLPPGWDRFKDELQQSKWDRRGESKPKVSSLLKRFSDYVDDIDSDFFAGYEAGRDDVISYIEKVPVSGHTAEDARKIRKERARLAEKLLKQFVEDELEIEEKEQIESEWNKVFNMRVDIDPSKIPVKIEGLSKTFKGREYQIRDVQTQFISKFIQKGVACAAHQVGVGKTMSGIIGTVSNMQMGRCKKPVIVVPSSVLQKWGKEFKSLYPGVPLNEIGTKQLNKMLETKGKFEVPEGSVTVMSYDAFNRFSFSEERLQELTKDMKDQLSMDEPKSNGKDLTEREKAKKKEKEEALKEGLSINTDERLQFDKSGFDAITVDEAHNFNNIFTQTRQSKGKQEANEYDGLLGGKPSQQGIKMWLASRHILKANNNRNVMLLTATPFTNNPLQAYSLLSLMAKEKLEAQGIYSIKDFINMYVDTEEEFTVEANGQIKTKKTVRSFKNPKAFRALINEFFDYKTGENAGINRPQLHRKVIQLKPTQEQVSLRRAMEVMYDLKDEDGKPLPGAPLKSITNQRLSNISPALVQDLRIGNAESGFRDLTGYQGNPEEYGVKRGMGDSNLDKALYNIRDSKDYDEFFSKTKEYLQELIKNNPDKLPAVVKQEYLKTLNINKDSQLENFYESMKEGIEERIEKREKLKKLMSGSGDDYEAEYGKIPPAKADYGKNFVERSPKIQFTLDSIAKYYKEMQKTGKPIPGQIVFLPEGVKFSKDMVNYLVKKHGIPKNALAIMGSAEKGQKASDPDRASEGISRFEEITEQFNDPSKELKIVIGSDVIKEGVDLNGNTAVAYNLMTSWNPTDEQQKLGRGWRQGNKQKNFMFVDVLIEDSIDSKLNQKQGEKASRINDIFLDSGDQSAIDVSEVNPDDLKLDIIKDPIRKAKVASMKRDTEIDVERRDEQSRILRIQGSIEKYYAAKRIYDYNFKEMSGYKEKLDKLEKQAKAIGNKDYKKEDDYIDAKQDYDRHKKEVDFQKKVMDKEQKNLDKYKINLSSQEEAEKVVNKMQEEHNEKRSIDSKEKDDRMIELIQKYQAERKATIEAKKKAADESMDSIVSNHVKELLDMTTMIDYAKSKLIKKLNFIKSKLIQRVA